MEARNIATLAVSPADASHLLLASTTGLYVSRNAGNHWDQFDPAILPSASQVAFTPGNPNRIYARSYSLYHSGDGGLTWQALSNPADMCDFAIAPTDADRLYAYPCKSDRKTTLLRSDDGGRNWYSPDPTFTVAIHSLVVLPENADILVAASEIGILRSENGGKTWASTSHGEPYRGRLVYDLRSPGMLYLAYEGGLLRSPDGGLTWQSGDLNRSLFPLVLTEAGVIYGGTGMAWRITSSGQNWQATAWDVPQPLTDLWTSPSSSHIFYAQTGTNLWRLIKVPSNHQAFMPMVFTSRLPSNPSSSAQVAVDRLNEYRTLAGAPPLLLHNAITSAAQNHAEYTLQNWADTSAFSLGAHGEVNGKQHFTGLWPWDRMLAAGYPADYPWWGGAEIVHYLGDPVGSIDGWMSTVYHRVIPLDPFKQFSGYGMSREGDTSIDVMDFGSGLAGHGAWTPERPYPLAYPADGQVDIPPAWNGSETPDPLPSGAARPVGYPFTLQGVRGELSIQTVELRGPNGELIPVHPSPPECKTFNCYALIPVNPLQSHSQYSVHAAGEVGGVPFDRVWMFSTGEG